MPGPEVEPLPGFVRDRPTVVLYAALGVFGALQVVPGLVAPALRDELGYGYALAGLHLSAFAALSVVAGLVAPRLDRRWGRRPLLLLGLAGMTAGTAALTAGRTPAATVAAAAAAGLLGTAILVTVQAALSDRHGERRAVAFAESNVVASAGTTLAPLLVGAAAAALGSWRWGVLLLAATGLLVAAVVRRLPVAPPQATVPAAATRAGPMPTLVRHGIALVFSGVVLEWSVSYWGATYLRDVVGLERASAVTAMTGFFAAMLVGRLIGGILVRRRDPAALVATSLATVAVGLGVQATSTAPTAAVGGLVLLGLGTGVLFPLGLALAVAGAPDRAAEISGRCIVAGSAAVLLGPLVVGQLADAVGLRAALLLLPVTAAAAIALLARYRWLRGSYRRNTSTSVRAA